jgi:hypothetical protein
MILVTKDSRFSICSSIDREKSGYREKIKSCIIVTNREMRKIRLPALEMRKYTKKKIEYLLFILLSTKRKYFYFFELN